MVFKHKGKQINEKLKWSGYLNPDQAKKFITHEQKNIKLTNLIMNTIGKNANYPFQLWGSFNTHKY